LKRWMLHVDTGRECVMDNTISTHDRCLLPTTSPTAPNNSSIRPVATFYTTRQAQSVLIQYSIHINSRVVH
jgi:hypothetical protein